MRPRGLLFVVLAVLAPCSMLWVQGNTKLLADLLWWVALIWVGGEAFCAWFDWKYPPGGGGR